MLILMAHGSRNPSWRSSLERLTDQVQELLPDQQVKLAFMQFTGPTLEEVVKEARDRGITTFRLLPLFMARAGHVENDILPLVEDLESRFPEAGFQLMTPVGEDPAFPGLLRTIATRRPVSGLT